MAERALTEKPERPKPCPTPERCSDQQRCRGYCADATDGWPRRRTQESTDA